MKDGCSRCPKGRSGNCPGVRLVTEYRFSPELSTYDQRATVSFEAVGFPCDKQTSYLDLLDTLEEEFYFYPKPANCRELNDFLLQLSKILEERLPHVPKALEPVFQDSVPGAIFNLLASLDYYYTKHGYNILEVLQYYFEDYRREDVFHGHQALFMQRVAFYTRDITVLFIEMYPDTVLIKDDTTVTTEPKKTPSKVCVSIEKENERDFIIEKCRLLAEDVTTKTYMRSDGRDHWHFIGKTSPKLYAFLGLMLYKAMGHDDVIWSDLSEIVELRGSSIGYAKKLASYMKTGKTSFPDGRTAINSAISEIYESTIMEKPKEK